MKAINKERMLAEFKEVVAVPCHTLQEHPVFELLRVKLEALGFIVEEDDAGEKLGGNCGNLWAFLPGNKVGATSVLFSAHMDGVEPCGGTAVVQKTAAFTVMALPFWAVMISPVQQASLKACV